MGELDLAQPWLERASSVVGGGSGEARLAISELAGPRPGLASLLQARQTFAGLVTTIDSCGQRQWWWRAAVVGEEERGKKNKKKEKIG